MIVAAAFAASPVGFAGDGIGSRLVLVSLPQAALPISSATSTAAGGRRRFDRTNQDTRRDTAVPPLLMVRFLMFPAVASSYAPDALWIRGGGGCRPRVAGVTQAPARVFCARLAGLLVLDPNGDVVGRIRDVVVALRLRGQPPRVLGLSVEVSRRRIFVTMSRVTGIESGAVVLGSGTLNWRRFERRPEETLVLAELLDRKVTLLESGAEVTVLDVAMEQSRTRDWLLTQVAVREGRRRGPVKTVDWDAVTGFSLPEEGQGAANLLAAFEKLRPADLASMLHDLSDKRRAEVAAALDDERLAAVLEEMPEDEQVELLGGLEDERAADVLEAMGPDDAADLLGDLPIEEAERLLDLMEPQEAAPVRRLLSYADDTAGGIMTSEPIILPPNSTVAEALARIRSVDIPPALAAQVYVVRPPYETPAVAARAAGHPRRRHHRHRDGCAAGAGPARGGHAPPCLLQPGGRSGRGLRRPVARRRDGRRRARPPAPAGLARTRLRPVSRASRHAGRSHSS